MCLVLFCRSKKGETLRGNQCFCSCFADSFTVVVQSPKAYLVINITANNSGSQMCGTYSSSGESHPLRHPSVPVMRLVGGRVGEFFVFFNNPICTLLQTHWLAKSAQQHFSPCSDFVFNTETLYEQIPN